jgi:hypothetical protein
LTRAAARPTLRRPMVSPRSLPWLAACLAAACTTPLNVPEVVGAFEGHPSAVVRGGLQVEARYYVDQARIFGGDLAEDHRLLPIALRVGRAEGAPAGATLDPDDMQLTLHLADGTSLGRVPPESADVRRRRLERLLDEGFGGGVLAPWESSAEGFVYFALPERLRMDSSSLRVVERAGDATRSLDLSASLLTFEVVGDEGPLTVAVGIAIDRRGARGE